MSRKNAFTLVELLVVIAIIALLMSMLMPALSKTKEQARNVVCRGANLRQYGIAAAMYLDDNEGTFPPTHRYLFTGAWSACQWHDEERWATVDGPMWPYLGAIKVHLCPSFKSLAKNIGQNHPFHDPKVPVIPQYGYSMNAFLGPYEAPWEASGRFERVTQIRHPANVFLFAEENMWLILGLSYTVLNDTNLWIGAPYDTDYDFFGTFHSAPKGDRNRGTCNAVFVDGHVEKLDLMDGTLDEAREKAWEVSWPAWPATQKSATAPPPE